MRTRWGIDLELTGEDEEHWYFRYYLHAEPTAAPPAPAPANAEPPPEVVALPESAPLRFEPFGAGSRSVANGATASTSPTSTATAHST